MCKKFLQKLIFVNIHNITMFNTIYFTINIYKTHKIKNWDGRIRTSEMAGPKPAALPLGDVPLLFFNYYNMISRFIVKII